MHSIKKSQNYSIIKNELQINQKKYSLDYISGEKAKSINEEGPNTKCASKTKHLQGDLTIK